MQNEPLIWTLYGNLPVNSLRYVHEWDENENEVTFSESWFTQEGELVKNNCHKLAKRQLTIGGEQAVMA
jgi:hypothetical protein